jgi:hypothetical protein
MWVRSRAKAVALQSLTHENSINKILNGFAWGEIAKTDENRFPPSCRQKSRTRSRTPGAGVSDDSGLRRRRKSRLLTFLSGSGWAGEVEQERQGRPPAVLAFSVLVIADHSAKVGSDPSLGKTLHRINEGCCTGRLKRWVSS